MNKIEQTKGKLTKKVEVREKKVKENERKRRK